jgi:hypothetical protein
MMILCVYLMLRFSLIGFADLAHALAADHSQTWLQIVYHCPSLFLI